ncbi:hypothetical protein EV2_030535 [Malus domestica]
MDDDTSSFSDHKLCDFLYAVLTVTFSRTTAKSHPSAHASEFPNAMSISLPKMTSSLPPLTQFPALMSRLRSLSNVRFRYRNWGGRGRSR